MCQAQSIFIPINIMIIEWVPIWKLMKSESSQGGGNAVNREVLRHASTLGKRNKHLFLKDYSAYTNDQYIFDNFSHFQSLQRISWEKGITIKV